jgi:hypothetical protein
MSRQGRLLAGQAVLSALILIVVYVTLLRPEGGGSLSGVETPQPSFPSGQGDRQGADRRADDRDGDRRRTLAAAPGLAPSLLETDQLPTPSAGPSVDGEQPTDDQYSDTLGQLRTRLAGG